MADGSGYQHTQKSMEVDFLYADTRCADQAGKEEKPYTEHRMKTSTIRRIQMLIIKRYQSQKMACKWFRTSYFFRLLTLASKNSRYGCICCFYYGDELRTDHFTVMVFEKR